MVRTNKKFLARLRRKRRVRKKIFGTAERPRLSVFRSAKHIYAQIINDEEGRTLVAASTLSKDLRAKVNELKGQGKVAQARLVGEYLAQMAREKGITKVCFDRAGYRYHGRVKALAEGAREGGLEF
ncbi:50S ribosomal protein L18 [Thermosulfuriphilus ammonigenes]|uniref:Large ribosomal subunit protein uL18 n=1 Tax=Thermosulfuriphilus ammonigenes TaxID=1936021 RepID=A0A6G7PUX1_9BACT|nr:50S ribosomal protein L18 [Thermosulfuriphilus ammonigenes]MBA2848534.1 large subunit ribosomal protein L18 [Thermosulfuriphilus ammonigenes]QIJ71321.1 50S ribosomal protein L18 [Thermosulfuriphilus ammonigenes]